MRSIIQNPSSDTDHYISEIFKAKKVVDEREGLINSARIFEPFGTI